MNDVEKAFLNSGGGATKEESRKPKMQNAKPSCSDFHKKYYNSFACRERC